MAGTFTGTVAFGQGFPVSIDSTPTVEFNNTTTAINDSFSYTDASGQTQTQTLALQAGPFLQVAAYNTNLHIGSVVLHGDVLFQRATIAGATTIVVGVAHVAPITRAARAARSRTAAARSSCRAPAAWPASSSAMRRWPSARSRPRRRSAWRSTRRTARSTPRVTVNGTDIPVNIPDQGFTFIANDVAINLDNLVEIDGNFRVSSGSFSGSGLQLFVGAGPYKWPAGDTAHTPGDVNPDAIGVLLDQGTVQYQAGTGDGLYALYASGTLSLIGLDGLTIQGNAVLEINTTGSQVVFHDPSAPTDPTKDHTLAREHIRLLGHRNHDQRRLDLLAHRQPRHHPRGRRDADPGHHRRRPLAHRLRPVHLRPHEQRRRVHHRPDRAASTCRACRSAASRCSAPTSD